MLTSAGGVKCWGDDGLGELGDGRWFTESLTPVGVFGLAPSVAAISAGGDHTCALTSKGGVECWGNNYNGELGDGTERDRLTPVGVSGLASGVTAISAGEGAHTCALTSASGVKCWGDNQYGQIGDGTRIDRRFPIGVRGLASGVTAIAAGGSHTCALTSAGAVMCWGKNRDGELGDGTRRYRLKPVAVSELASGVTAISAGASHTCAVTTAGGVKCWGWNGHGQLGDGTEHDRLTPVDVFGLQSGVVAVAVGKASTCALTSAGGVKCWGHNADGEVGDGTEHDRLRPVSVSGLTSGVTAISAGDGHTCALTSRGRIKCWGLNVLGELGDGTTILSLAPIGVVGFGGSVECGVPQVIGEQLARARTTIVRAHCRVGRVTRETSKKDRNIVLRQSPLPYTRLKKGSKVRLTVSRGR